MEDKAVDYEQQIHRLKLLSKSQTLFLKQFIHNKLATCVSLTNKTLDTLNRLNIKDSKIDELKHAINSLNLGDLEGIDATSTQLQFHEELTLLRAATGFSAGAADVKNKIDRNESKSNGDSKSDELFEDNARLKELVKSLKDTNQELTSQIKTLNDSKSVKTVADSNTSAEMSKELSKYKEDILSLQNEVESLKAIQISNAKALDNNDIVLREKEQVIKTKDNLITTLQTELDNIRSGKESDSKSSMEQLISLQTKVASLEEQLVQARREGDDRLAKKVEELEQYYGDKMKEADLKLESEKDILMEAMTQELEALEKQKDEEKSTLSEKIKDFIAECAQKDSEKAALEASIRDLNKEIAGINEEKKSAVNSVLQEKNKLMEQIARMEVSQTNVNKVLKNLGQMHLAARNLVKESKLQTEMAKKDISDMQKSLKIQLGGALITKMNAIFEQSNVVMQKYKKEVEERKKLHNLIQELKGNIRVFMRCRPPTTKELEQFGDDAACVSFPNPGEVKVFNEKNREKVWEFDEIFDTASTQEAVYKEVSALVTSVMDGFNVCIFAYGQTGSGKTWTMSGPSSNRGVNTRALDELFHKSATRRADYNDTISVSILEVYNEAIRDLLVDGGSSDKLEIRQSDQGNYVPGLTQVPVESLQNVIDLLAVADRNRSSASTNMKEHSSRSHMMLTVTVVSENLTLGVTTRGKLNLVDLAGSERLDKTGASGQALKEAQNINKSLSALGDVIAARANKQSHVPFRNSTLTYLLQDSLSQDSKTLMIVCVSPVLYNSEETFCSLNFASRVRSVELGKATKNVQPAGGATKTAAKK